jgi:hypothetical protein
MSSTTGVLVFVAEAVSWAFLVWRFVIAGAFFVPISLTGPLSAVGSLS